MELDNESLDFGDTDYDELDEGLDEELGEPLGLTISPETGYRTDKFKVTIYGMDKKGWIASSKPGYGRINDPKIRMVDGNETFEVTGEELLKDREFKEHEDALIWVYACDDRLITNKYSDSVQVMIRATPQEVPTTPSPGEPTIPPSTTCIDGDTDRVYDATYKRHYIRKCVDGKWVFSHWEAAGESPIAPPPPGTEPKYLSIDEARERTAAGLQCYIKCVLPLLDLLPGLPWSSSIPILPGFVITKRP
ncbi:MAG: hypothetical protein J7K40_13745 [candidate division Zixibacteria bacterium]|nr:hypothetical protein [candidate division Zixibacteria bacterium]